MKTNHQRNFREKYRGFGSYLTFSKLDTSSLSGEPISAWSHCGDHANGKHGISKDRRGAKKFIHSRRRRQDRDALKNIIGDK